MHPQPLPAAMKIALLALALALAPVAAAAPAETIRQCSELGCVVVADQDGDGAYEWANAAIVPGRSHLLGVFANVNGTTASYAAEAGTEEIVPHDAHDALEGAPEAVHEVVEAVPLHESFVVLVDGEADEEASETRLRLDRGDEETGEWEDLAVATLAMRDADADGLPDAFLTILL